MKLIGLAGWSGAGKTTLLVKVIPRLRDRGLAVSTLKHAHHAFEIDTPGKDSFEQRRAGAHEVLVASAKRLALMRELRGAPEPPLADLIRMLSPVDLVIVEGFKAYGHPKIAIHRAANGKPPLAGEGVAVVAPNVRALLTDAPVPGWRGPVADLDDAEAACDLFLAHAEPVETVLAGLDAAGPAPRLRP